MSDCCGQEGFDMVVMNDVFTLISPGNFGDRYFGTEVEHGAIIGKRTSLGPKKVPVGQPSRT